MNRSNLSHTVATTRTKHLKGLAIAAFVLLQVPAVVLAAESQTLTAQLLERDGQLALQKLDHELAKLGAGPTAPQQAAAGVGAPVEVRSAVPHTIAIFGIDGRAAGLPVALRSVVSWDGEVYAAKPGGSVRGYRVAAIDERTGTKLVKGRQVVEARPAQTMGDVAVVNDSGAPSPTSEPASSAVFSKQSLTSSQQAALAEALRARRTAVSEQSRHKEGE